MFRNRVSITPRIVLCYLFHPRRYSYTYSPLQLRLPFTLHRGSGIRLQLTMASQQCLRRALPPRSPSPSMPLPQALRSSLRRNWQSKVLGQRLFHNRTAVVSARPLTYSKYHSNNLAAASVNPHLLIFHRTECLNSRAVGVSFMQQRSYGVYPPDVSGNSTNADRVSSGNHGQGTSDGRVDIRRNTEAMVKT